MRAVADRICPNCQAANPLDLSRKCVKCKKRMPEYCFGCFAAVADEATSCGSCGRRRWNLYDTVELRCAQERGTPLRKHRYMATVMKDKKVQHEWRCMTCLTDDTHTDAFTHFAEGPGITAA
jgi:hypothetical protein